LVGRDRELSGIRSFLERAAHSGDAMLIIGEPGVGKTVLLDEAAQAASAARMSVLRAAGVQFEAEMPYSGLHQALLPLHERLAQLSAAHRAALNVALGFGDGPTPDRLLVSNATLDLLRRSSGERSAVLVVDDLPWLDRASASVLGFVARRLAGTRLGFLAACRTGEESFFERAGLPELELGPLDDEAARDLMTARFPTLAPTVQVRLLEEAEGNPLAVLELPAALSGPQRAAMDELPPVLPLTRRLEALFRSRVAGLSDRTRRLLLLVALDRTGDARVLQAVGGSSKGLEDLAAAEEAGLAFIDGRTHRLAFRHPMIRSEVVELSTVVERRAAHRALADLWTDQPDRQVWHLADAAVGEDEQVATLLEQAGRRVLRRGDGVAAVSALVRAAGLSEDAAERARRLAAAAYIGAGVTGDLDNASRLLADARGADPQLGTSLQAAATAALLLLNGDGDVDTAHRLLVGAIDNHPVGEARHRDVLAEAAHTLLMVCHFGGRPELWEPLERALDRLGTDLPGVLTLSSRTLADPVRTARPILDELEAAVERLIDEIDPVVIVRTAIAAFYTYRLGRCREALWRVVRGSDEQGMVGTAINALALLGYDSLLSGEWALAGGLAGQAVELCEANGLRLLAWPARYVQALLAAARGEFDASRAIADELQQWAAPRGVRAVRWYAEHVQTLAALGRGDADEAYRHASAISPAGTFASHVYFALQVPMDLVEAAVRTGRGNEAAAHVAAMRGLNIAALSPRLAVLAAGSAAMAARAECGLELFAQALSIPGGDRWPFDLARVQLAYGERLRRAGSMTEARFQLSSALETFERLEAKPWLDRASNELRATGQVRARAGQRDCECLTPQELEIARLAARGLSNKQIGERLYLSHRTVGAHLYRIFPKLAITSRAALRDALGSLESAQDKDDAR